MPNVERLASALIHNQTFLDVLPNVEADLAAAGIVGMPVDVLDALSIRDRQHVLSGVDAIFGPKSLDPDELDLAGNLKVLSLAASGFEWLDVDAYSKRGIVVTNAPTPVGSESVAELAIGLMFAVARSISAADRDIKRGAWNRGMGTMLSGKSVGIIGFGRIGQAVAVRVISLGMTVRLLEHHASNAKAIELGAEFGTLADLLELSDFVTLHGRYSESTHHMLGRAELIRMKPTAFLINTARAGIVDTEALREVLVTQRIAGAGLDVHDPEPKTLDALLALPNVVATPHLGNRTWEGVVDVVRCSIENARLVLSGQRPDCVVNPEVYE
jgi:phosphoglycerate dehydrogenase-like enzyme